jgi:hypothetical protein
VALFDNCYIVLASDVGVIVDSGECVRVWVCFICTFCAFCALPAAAVCVHDVTRTTVISWLRANDDAPSASASVQCWTLALKCLQHCVSHRYVFSISFACACGHKCV